MFKDLMEYVKQNDIQFFSYNDVRGKGDKLFQNNIIWIVICIEIIELEWFFFICIRIILQIVVILFSWGIVLGIYQYNLIYRCFL